MHIYLDTSAGGAIFSSYHFDTLVKFAKRGLDKKSLKKMLDNDKYLNVYTREFIKLDAISYNEIIAFYKTDAGKKYAKAMYEMAKINKNKIEELYGQSKCVQDKQIFIDKIEKELNLVDLKMASAKETFHIINNIQPNYLKRSINEMEIYENTYKSKLVQREKKMSCIMYKDFTLKELNEIYKYASSEVGKSEAKLMYESFSRYLKVFLKDIMAIQRTAN